MIYNLIFPRPVKLLRSIFAVVCFAVALTVQPADAFIHPGIPFTLEDLNAVKANLTNAPWASGYSQLVSSGYASTNYTMQGPYGMVARNLDGTGVNIGTTQIGNDNTAAYYNALMWYFTGDSNYAQKSHDILMAWANTMTNLTGYEGPFLTGGEAPHMITAADILRGTWPGWTISDTTNYCRFLTNVFWPETFIPNTVLSANQGGYEMMGAVAIAVFCDDTNRFNQAVSALLMDADAGFRDTLPNGEVGDTQRDQGHSFGQLLNVVWPAEICWKQGVDIYTYLDNRILATTEYYGRYNLPGPAQPHQYFGATYSSYMYAVPGGGPRSSGQNRMVFNIVQGAYATRLGIMAPWTTLYRNDQNESPDSFLYRKAVDSSVATNRPAASFPATASLTTGLTSADLNGNTPGGSTSYSGGVWTLTSGYGGNDPWLTAGNDSVRFAYKQQSGDFTMIARVTSVSNVGAGNARAGIMLRDSLTTAANRCWVALTPNQTIERAVIGWANLQYGANMANAAVTVPQTPYWVKMERIGQRVQVFHSPNGADWTPTLVVDLPGMPATMYVGLFGVSMVSGVANTATIDNVRLTGGDGLEAVKVPPAPFAVYAGPGDTLVQLRWNEAFTATAYNVKRSLTSGSGYTTIATVTNTTYTDTNLLNDTTYYYVVTATNAAGESANSIGDSATPQLAMVNVATAGSAEDDAGNANGAEGAAMAFDIDPSSKWLGNPTGWLQYDLGSFVRQTVRRYAITSANDFPGRDPKDWQFLASNDGANWTALDIQTNQIFTYRYQTITYPLANTNAYRYYRLDVVTNNGENSTQLSELALLAIAGTGTNLITGEIVWNGAINGTWDTSTANWLSNSIAAMYRDGVAVVFDDTATGSTSVTLASAATPAAVSFNNYSKSYTLAGSAISGVATLLKTGIGSLTLNIANAYSGGTTIADGTLTLGNAGALGTGSLQIYGGTLNNNLGNLTLTNAVLMSGSVNVYAANGVNFNLAGPLIGGGTLVNNVANLNASLTISGDLNDFTGTIVYLDANNTYNNFNLGGATANSLNASRAKLSVSGGSNLARRLNLNGSPFQLGDISGSGGTVAINGTLAVGALNLNSTFAGMFPNTTGNLVKVGTGTLTLLGANAYTGQTTVSNGELAVSTLFSGKGNFVVTTGATLGVTNAGSGSAIVSNLTLAAGTTLDLRNVTSAATPLMVASNLNVGGSCILKIMMPPTALEGAYPLVNYAGTFTGTFTNLKAQLSANVSNVFGGTLVSNANQVSLTIAAIAAPAAPATLTASAGNAQIGLSWSTSVGAGGYQVWRSATSGGGYSLLTSTATINYLDANVTNNVAYYYVVTATNSFGSSGYSPEAAAVPRFVVVWTGATNAIWDAVTTNWANGSSSTTYRDGAVAWFDDTALSNYSITLPASAAPAMVVVSNSANNYMLGGSAITGTGSLLKAGSFPLYLSGANTFSGGATNLSGYIVLSGNTAGDAGSVTSGPLGTGLLTMKGGSLGPDNTAVRTNANAIQVATGTTSALGTPWSGKNIFLTGALSGGGTLQSDPGVPAASYTTFLLGNLSQFTGTLSYSGVISGNGANWRVGTNNSTVDLSQATVVLTGSSSKNFGFTDNSINILLKIGALSGNGYFQGCYTNTAGVGSGMVMQVGLLNTDATFSGQLGISGNNMANFSFVKAGSGTQWLTGPDIYSGQTTVSNGELVISTAFSGNGNFWVTNGATLGVTNLSSTSALISNLTMAAGSTLELMNVASATTALISMSNVVVGGNCGMKITGTNNLIAGNTYPLLKYAASQSGITNLQLQMPYGWRGTLVNSNKQIYLASVGVVATDSPMITTTALGSQLQLTWSSTHIGWRLQVQTNSSSTGLGTNWVDSVDVSATNQFSLPITSTNGSVFYRLVYP